MGGSTGLPSSMAPRHAFQLLGVPLALCQLPAEPFEFRAQAINPILTRLPVRVRHANVMPSF